jgi:hypothetical protein
LNKKSKKIGVILERLGFGWVGDKMGILGIWVAGGEWVRWRMAGGGVLVVGGGGWWWVWVYFGFREKMTKVGLGSVVRPKGKMGERGGGEM